MKRRFLLALCAFVTAGGLAGCGDTLQSLTSDYKPTTDASGRVSFVQVRPTLLEKCAICHNEYNDSAKILHGASKVYDAVNSYYMPASGVAPLAPQDRIDLLAWLNENRALWTKGGN